MWSSDPKVQTFRAKLTLSDNALLAICKAIVRYKGKPKRDKCTIAFVVGRTEKS